MKKDIKICFLVANEFVYDNAIFYRAKALASVGYKITVTALMDRKARLNLCEKKENFSISRINVISRRLPPLTPIKILRYFEYMIKGIITCTKEKADIYHACGCVQMLLMGVIVSGLAKAKLVYDTKDFHADEKIAATLVEKIEKKAIYIFEKILIKKADEVIASSDSIADKIRDIYDIKLPVTVRECKPFSMVEGSNKIREKLGIPAGQRTIIYFGNIVKGRNLDVLIKAAEHFENATAVLMGEGNYRKPLMDLVSKLNLSEKVKFLGIIPFEEVAGYISSADIGITLFRNDCFNDAYNIDNRLFYYIACGVPVASSDNFERKKLIEGYGLGVIFDIDNPKDIAEKINSLLRDKALYAKVKNRVIEAAKSTLNLENESIKLLEMYNKLCKTKN